MTLLIHDIASNDIGELNFKYKLDIINANEKAASCIGCFDCWLKNKGYCSITDNLQHIGKKIGQSENIIIVSSLCYGSYSPNVKRLIDRSISTSLPFFTYRKWKTHHLSRYSNKSNLTVVFYGKANDFEKSTANEFVYAHSINSNAKHVKIIFCEDETEVLGGILNEYIDI